MKRNVLLLALLLSVYSIPIRADHDGKKAAESTASETWSFYSVLKEFTPEELAAAGNHKLGKEVACLYDRFLEAYVVKEEVVPGDPARRTVIKKPSIYNSVCSIERQLNKDIKSKKLTVEEASDEFGDVLRIALAAMGTYESNTFEKALQGNDGGIPGLRAIFERVELKNIY